MFKKLEDNYTVTTDSTGKTRIVFDPKKAEAKLDLSTRLKRKTSKRVSYGKKARLTQSDLA